MNAVRRNQILEGVVFCFLVELLIDALISFFGRAGGIVISEDHKVVKLRDHRAVEEDVIVRRAVECTNAETRLYPMNTVDAFGVADADSLVAGGLPPVVIYAPSAFVIKHIVVV
jgi:hypothetical protein